MSNTSKKYAVLFAAIVIGLIIFDFTRGFFDELFPDSGLLFAVLGGAIAGGLGAGIGSFVYSGLKKKMNIQESDK